MYTHVQAHQANIVPFNALKLQKFCIFMHLKLILYLYMHKNYPHTWNFPNLNTDKKT